MLRCVTAAVCLLLASATILSAQTDSADPHSKLFAAALAAHVMAHVADVSTTQRMAGQGDLLETSPLFRPLVNHPMAFGMVKGAYAVGTTYLFMKLHKHHPKLAIAVAAGSAVFTFTIAAQNMYPLRSIAP